MPNLRIRQRPLRLSLLPTAVILLTPQVIAAEPPLERIRVAADGRGFVGAKSGIEFQPRGFNYDHDQAGRLIEDYWLDQWDMVERHFGQMKALGANVVRVHLQLGRFLKAAEQPDQRHLGRLAQLVKLAEAQRLYLDLTGLGCYHKADVPTWYADTMEDERWQIQARFWQLVARQVAASPAVFCFDLMNEPVVPGGKRTDGDWLGPAFAGKHFVQFVTLDQRDRPRSQIARAWTSQLVRAIREVDRDTLITIGLVDWSLDRPGLTSGFDPKVIAPELDFLAVHIYPERGKIDAALDTLDGFALGKPVIVEETFPLKCSAAELIEFMDRSGPRSVGWISFYWGQTLDELQAGKTIGEAIQRDWLQRFPRK